MEVTLVKIATLFGLQYNERQIKSVREYIKISYPKLQSEVLYKWTLEYIALGNSPKSININAVLIEDILRLHKLSDIKQSIKNKETLNLSDIAWYIQRLLILDCLIEDIEGLLKFFAKKHKISYTDIVSIIKKHITLNPDAKSYKRDIQYLSNIITSYHTENKIFF